MSVVIKVENLSKQYRLGTVGTGSLKDDFKRWRYSMLGRENPFLLIGEENDRSTKSKSDYVWALRNINFEVNQGEVLAIIGRNGAGKSTLLKILSRTTGPSTGSIKMKGRIASLLEVGTGFHGELSGRENIYLNGALMGLRKHEITKRLDEIIDFAGVERYIDTPVKRYSSGMFVRLAFGVAAHLEPDIMIVDEVLAVGDADFQKKALGKMKDVSHREGRTVLFVSHNMAAVKQLCTRGVILENGKLQYTGDIQNTISNYFSRQQVKGTKDYFREGNKKAEFLQVGILDNLRVERNDFLMGEDVFFNFTLRFNNDVENLEVGVNVKNHNHDLLFHVCNFDDQFKISGKQNEIKNIRIRIPEISLTPGEYLLDVGAVLGTEKIDILTGFDHISIKQGPIIKRPGVYPIHTFYYSPSFWENVSNV